jgi:hypothetical protein
MRAKGWSNHEDTFEETIRREMLNLKKENEILKSDLKELTKAYYILLERRVDDDKNFSSSC